MNPTDAWPRTVCGALTLLLAGCLTVPLELRQREDHWRRILADEAPIGAPSAAVAGMYARHGLTPMQGTYHTVQKDGSETSHCRLPKRAFTAWERSAVRGLYIRYDIEVTVCLDENDRVEKHYVAWWNAGL